MANKEQLYLIEQGVDPWNQWRQNYPEIQPDLSEVNLFGYDLEGVDLSDTDLRGADLQHSRLSMSKLSKAILSGAYLNGANFYSADIQHAILNGSYLEEANLAEADFSYANLQGAYLSRADLSNANFSGANLSGANLQYSRLVDTNFRGANLDGCLIYGVSVWEIDLRGAKQTNLIITPSGTLEESTITVDNLEVAQFIYLLINNEKIRDVINSITSKAVLILGRFTPDRKVVLDALRNELRKHNYLPILFDFEKPNTRDTHETVMTLARLARFIIADITDPQSIPQELVSIVETLPSVPVKPLLKYGSEPWGMFDHIKRYKTVLRLLKYENVDDLLESLSLKIIAPAEAKARKLLKENSVIRRA